MLEVVCSGGRPSLLLKLFAKFFPLRGERRKLLGGGVEAQPGVFPRWRLCDNLRRSFRFLGAEQRFQSLPGWPPTLRCRLSRTLTSGSLDSLSMSAQWQLTTSECAPKARCVLVPESGKAPEPTPACRPADLNFARIIQEGRRDRYSCQASYALAIYLLTKKHTFVACFGPLSP